MSTSKLILLLSLVLLTSCSTYRKARAGKILSTCQFSMAHWSLDSVAVDEDLFPKHNGTEVSPFPNPHILGIAQDLLKGKTSRRLGTAWVHVDLVVVQSGKDSVWLRDLKGFARLDTLVTIPWKAIGEKGVGPGTQAIPLSITLPLDARLFRVMETDSMILSGGTLALLERDGAEIPLDFRTSKPTPKDEIKAFISNATNSILDAMLNGWAKSLN